MAELNQRSELITEVSSELKKGTTYDTTRIPVWLTMAEDWIDRNLRIAIMEQHVTLRLEGNNALSSVAGTDTITGTAATTITSAAYGDTHSLSPAANNTGAATLNIDGQGAVALEKYRDGEVNALEANDLVAGGTFYAFHDGTRYVLSPVGGVPLPSRFLGLKRIHVQGAPVRKLNVESPVNFWSFYLGSEAGKPKAVTVEGNFMVFGPHADATYQANLLYWRGFSRLTSDAHTNWLLSNARGVYLHGILVEAYHFFGDQPKMMRHAALRDQILQDLHFEDRERRYSGDGLIMRSDVNPV